MRNPYVLTSKRYALILACVLFALYPVIAASAQSNTVMRAQASTSQPRIGDTLTVKLTISNVQNLAGIDATLNWNSSVLNLFNVNLSLGVEAYPDGVLHGSKLNYDIDSVVSGDIYVSEDKSSGGYELLAQTIGQATSSFSGSGTIATLSFNVTGVGQTELSLQSDLSDHPVAGENANLITHTDVADAVNSVVPEFPTLIVIALLMILVTALSIFVKKGKKLKQK